MRARRARYRPWHRLAHDPAHIGIDRRVVPVPAVRDAQTGEVLIGGSEIIDIRGGID